MLWVSVILKSRCVMQLVSGGRLVIILPESLVQETQQSVVLKMWSHQINAKLPKKTKLAKKDKRWG
jgi:hypothetical protein